MVRIELTADDSFAAIRARSRLGIAIAAMIKMIATTISNSIKEKPFCFRIILFVPLFYSHRDHEQLYSCHLRSQSSGTPCFAGTAIGYFILQPRSAASVCPEAIQDGSREASIFA